MNCCAVSISNDEETQMRPERFPDDRFEFSETLSNGEDYMDMISPQLIKDRSLPRIS